MVAPAGSTDLRTGLSWADFFRPNAEIWFDRQMHAIEEFSTTLTLCFTPEHPGLIPHYTSPPRDCGEFAEFTRLNGKSLCSSDRSRFLLTS